MQETRIFDYFAFGYDYYLLRFKNEGLAVHNGPRTLINSINNFLNELVNLDLQVTIKASEKLQELLERIKKLPKEAKVDAELAIEVQKLMDTIDPTLDAELKLRNAYIVTPKRYRLDNLLKTPVELLANEVYYDIPAICRFDFKHACQCIAFGQPTAAAFHLMRCTEGVLRFYYCKIVKRGKTKQLLWGPIITHMRTRKKPPKKKRY